MKQDCQAQQKNSASQYRQGFIVTNSEIEDCTNNAEHDPNDGKLTRKQSLPELTVRLNKLVIANDNIPDDALQRHILPICSYKNTVVSEGLQPYY